jgi:ferredoxin-NADP reductase
MFKLIDKFLNQITMYRLVLYYVSGLWLVALALSFFSLLPYPPLVLIISGAIILPVCWVVNIIFARFFGAPSNIESVYTTAFILMLIVSPVQSSGYLAFFFWVAVLAMASKYILAINKKHIFNPAAFAVAVTAITMQHSANWWVNSVYLMPFVLIGGLLVVRKIRRFDLVLSFFIVSLSVGVILAVSKHENILLTLQRMVMYSAMFFFAFAMLTEPATTPPTRKLRILYGALVGFLFNPAVHIGSLYSTPELALIAGNVFSYLVSPKFKLVLKLKEKIIAATDVYDFWFTTDQKLQFKPGQYLEWTLGHEHQDARGMRRYFTIASSPTEEGIMAGVKFYPNSSSFKQSMRFLNPGETIVASQLAGDFVLPVNKNKKLVFMAGGIGVTPFRSMVKYLLDKQEKRDIVLMYSNYAPSDIAYKDIFDQAAAQLGIKTVYTITNQPYPANWNGETGFVNEAMLRREVPDFKDRIFYISGSRTMVVIFTDLLKKMGVPSRNIKTDFFPGFA